MAYNEAFDIPLNFLKGVGEARAKLFGSELEIHTFRDLLYNFPFRHIDRSRFYHISELTNDAPMLQIAGRFIGFSEEGEGAKQRLTGTFSDGRQVMQCVWFRNIKSIREMYRTGVDYVIFGKPTYYYGYYSMAHPEVEVYDPQKPPSGWRGVYNLTETLRKRGVTSRLMQTLVANLFENRRLAVLDEVLPAEIVSAYRLMPLREALYAMHFPSDAVQLQRATERMKFEELFYIELHILRYARQRNLSIQGHVFGRIGRYFNDFYANQIPFELTGAQKRVLREIRGDMRTGRQMNRLLQGDVGSGKTMVAFMTMLMAADNGFQAVLMAPTEILATQHYASLESWCAPLGLEVRLLTGSTGAAARREIDEGLRSGAVNFVVGTHALLEDRVTFARLGLAVIDEQHRFGVVQRARIWAKNTTPPHVLVMTATPIPRTLAMTVYGDLEVSVIDELPPGRKPVETMLRYSDNRMSVNRLVAQQLREGRQIYFVYPLIRENEKLNLQSLEEGYRVVCDTFRNIPVSFVHGQMKPDEKDHQMQLFVTGQTRIMVATTVIEVGVNVPNASVMVIENAERFGLSQLHQLRGRVGRGADKSYCILMSKANMAATTRKRLTIMTETTDGFLISEADMRLRGPGDMEGTQQSGLAFSLKVADLARDGQILARAREAARQVLDAAPQLYRGGVVPETGNCAGVPTLTPESLGILERELRYRFAHKVDWSQIS
ncbi:MAG: ATP-dependent DNA helicase RecG [Bacteroides sp.]|nr:ATP-dependent DNA helicase RecG [Bacteroides sp.]